MISNKYHDYNLISNNLVLRSLKMSPSRNKWAFGKKRKIVKMINMAHWKIILKPNKLLLSLLARELLALVIYLSKFMGKIQNKSWKKAFSYTYVGEGIMNYYSVIWVLGLVAKP